MVHDFASVLGLQTVLMGLALPDDRIHAPNEKMSLPNFFRGIETCVWFLELAGRRLGLGDRRRPPVTCARVSRPAPLGT